MQLGKFIAVLLFALSIGCNNEPSPVTVSPGPPPVKAMLEDLSQTGEMSSGISEIDAALTEMKSTDPAKAEKLLKELDELRSATSADDIKTKAKAMADQL